MVHVNGMGGGAAVDWNKRKQIPVRREVGWGHGCIMSSLSLSLSHHPLPRVMSLPAFFPPLSTQRKYETGET